jgi:hypothetical protein
MIVGKRIKKKKIENECTLKKKMSYFKIEKVQCYLMYNIMIKSKKIRIKKKYLIDLKK